MSIKYLQDQQLNQVQRSPNDSPWAKLVAQSELLERSRMRQPQGQVPQGTVAGDIQQQLMAAQQQESERQNAELQKAQLLASLINSGHFAAGGLTQPVGTGAYRGILMSNPSVAGPAWSQQAPQATYIPPDSLDSAAQQKKHGMIQSLLDNSAIGMMQGKANIGDALQSYADLFSGKAFSRGFAEGGDIRGYAAGGGLERFLNKYPNHPMSTNVSPYLEAPKGVSFGDIPQLQEVLSSAKTNSELAQLLKQGEISNLAGTLFNVASQREQANATAKTSALQRLTQTLGQVPEAMAQQNLAPEEAARAARAAQYQDVLSNWPQMEANKWYQEGLDKSKQTKALPHIAQVSESPELQALYKNIYGPKPEPTRGDILSQQGKANAFESPQMRVPTRESMLRQAQGAPTGVDPLAAFKNEMYGTKPDYTHEEYQAAKSAANEAAAKTKAQTEALSQSAKPNYGYDRPSYQTTPEFVNKGASAMREGIASVGRNIGNVASKVTPFLGPIGDIASANYTLGNPAPLAAKALGVDVPNVVNQGYPSPMVMDLMQSPTNKLNEIGSSLSEIGSGISSYYDKFKNKGNQPDAWAGAASLVSNPSKVETQIPHGTAPTTPAIPQGTAPTTPTVPQEKVIRPTPGATKAAPTSQNTAVINQVHGQSTSQSDTPVAQAAAQHAAILQANQAVKGSSDEEGQGSVLDSLYNKLKDSAVDYSELAKRISENEYDLARERKDGTFNAILGGIGAALSRAGTYEGVGDRVFKPGIGAIAGAGILGGLKLSEAAEAKYAQGHKENTNALLALQKLKGESLNNVLDAISAQKQMEVAKAGATETARHNVQTEKTKGEELALENVYKGALTSEAIARANELNATADKARNSGNMSKQDEAYLKSLDGEIGDLTSAIANMSKELGAKNNPDLVNAQRRYNSLLAQKASLLQSLGYPTGQSAPTPTPLVPNTTKAWEDLGYSVKSKK